MASLDIVLLLITTVTACICQFLSHFRSIKLSDYCQPNNLSVWNLQEMAWKEKEPEERRVDFVPRSYSSLRLVPSYPRYVNELFERCLDLYLCPRQRKMRVSFVCCILILESLLFYFVQCGIIAQCGLRGCKNRPAPFPGRMSYKATKPGS